MTINSLSGSFRDPAGFVFKSKGILYRQINQVYKEHYLALMEGGLFKNLVGQKMLVSHDEVDLTKAMTKEAFKVICPQVVPFISYPYEWCFSQLKEAALLTIDIQTTALDSGLSLRDASAYNVQFIGSQPIFIDTLSFEKYRENTPWSAYLQFCQHFLAPLALMSHIDVRLNHLLSIYIDGIPLDLVSKLLPMHSKLNINLGVHIGLHAKSQKKYANFNDKQKITKRKFSYQAFVGLLDSLRSSVENLKLKPAKTEWHDYYESNNNYGQDGLDQKERLVTEFLAAVSPQSVWDLGANTGRFSRLAIKNKTYTVAWDKDHDCVETNYRIAKDNQEKNLLPLLLDLTNPSPGIGWANKERAPFAQRGDVDAILALG